MKISVERVPSVMGSVQGSATMKSPCFYFFVWRFVAVIAVAVLSFGHISMRSGSCFL